ncbi:MULTISPECIES: hypothetical protein [unclassified Streptomyces]|uniref:hypothetical protein n=1 Tax=unclassified Streptomyces TaxID=2593676 RepID=UPI00380C5922
MDGAQAWAAGLDVEQVPAQEGDLPVLERGEPGGGLQRRGGELLGAYGLANAAAQRVRRRDPMLQSVLALGRA